MISIPLNLFQVTKGQDEIGSFIDIILPLDPYFLDLYNKLRGKNIGRDHEHHEEPFESWKIFLKQCESTLAVLFQTLDGFRIYVVSDKHFQLLEITPHPSDCFTPTYMTTEKIQSAFDDYIQTIDKDKLQLISQNYDNKYICEELELEISLNQFNEDLDSVLNSLDEKTFCILTATNLKKLERDITQFEYYRIDTIGKNDSNDAFIILDITELAAITMMNKFHQEYAIFGQQGSCPYIIYQDKV